MPARTRNPAAARLRRDRDHARHRRAIGYWLVLLATVLSIMVSVSWQPPDTLRLVILFPHLAAVIVGLGAAVLIEVLCLLWVVGRMRLDEIRRIAGAAHAVVFVAFAVLMLTGAGLHVDPTRGLTVLKLAAVCVAGLNGVALTRLRFEMDRLPAGSRFACVPPRLQRDCVIGGLVSQVAWWTAVVIGMLNTAAA